MRQRPFRFGLQAGRTNEPNEWLELARKAERVGFSCLQVPDHLGRMATFPALMAAAAVTETIKLATYVLNQDFRPPSILAWDAATTHLLIGGRLELGLGAGWNIPEYRQAGIQYDPPDVRVDRFDEYVQVVKGALAASEPFSFSGKYFTLEGFLPLPQVPQGPPPILIGGGSRKISGIGGRLADIISVSTRATPEGKVDARNLTEQAVDQKVGWIRAAADSRFDDIELNMTVRHLMLTDDPHQAATQLHESWCAPGSRMAHADQITPDDLLRSPHIGIGTLEEVVTHFETARERWGFSYLEVSSGDMESVLPVFERLNGR
jgi:probable F420-dependent oxidoreductase